MSSTGVFFGGASGLRMAREAVSYTTWRGVLYDHP